MEPTELEAIEIDLLLEAVFRRWGYDFRSYARASIVRRLRQVLEQTDLPSVAELIPRILHEPAFLHELLAAFSITVSGMFRDPEFWLSLRRNVMPLLRTYPFIRVWIAGCAGGEEAYSMAILLQEEGLAGHATIYATDMNDQALAAAKKGIYPLQQIIREHTENHQKSGPRPQDSFSSYCHASQGHIVMNRELRRSITFANHNLVSDQVFAEMHLILCRNVMIYFNHELKDRVLRLLDSSLIRGGFLCVGDRENLRFTCACGWYEEIDRRNRICRKPMRERSGQRPDAIFFR